MLTERTARLYNCALCHIQVTICSDCDRGNIYCSKACTVLVRRASLASAGQRYQTSRKGRMSHAKRQKSYRQRQRQKDSSINFVTHQGSKDLAGCDLLLSEPEKVIAPNTSSWPLAKYCVHCHFCKKECSLFLRIGWMHRSDYRLSLSDNRDLKKMGELRNETQEIKKFFGKCEKT